MRNRSAVIIIKNDKVLLIKRARENSVYYVFPGGGIEENETPAEAAKREAREELGLEVAVGRCIAAIPFNGTQYYFLADILSGELGTGTGEEYSNSNRGLYKPLWVEIPTLSTLDVRPNEVSKMIIHK